MSRLVAPHDQSFSVLPGSYLNLKDNERTQMITIVELDIVENSFLMLVAGW